MVYLLQIEEIGYLSYLCLVFIVLYLTFNGLLNILNIYSFENENLQFDNIFFKVSDSNFQISSQNSSLQNLV